MESEIKKYKTKHWHLLDDGRVVCDVCPRHCSLRDGKKGACFIREAFEGEIVLTSYGYATGFAIDPVEKKPLNHFYPGTRVYSFGTAGCNLGCKYCQNWHISKSRDHSILSAQASPEDVAGMAVAHQCKSVAFTYNDPVIFWEYARDTAIECHNLGLKTIAVSAGYMCETPREEFYAHIDAANIDLKSISDHFYRKLCSGSLAPVLDTLLYLKQETDVWLEITTLLIPGWNDNPREIEQLSRWISDNLGDNVPLHFSGFHPDFKLTNIDRTPLDTLLQARDIALKTGLNYVYTGNILNENSESTYCPHCHNIVLHRHRYQLRHNHITPQGECMHCHSPIPGRF
ncbi:AmmeMemoRadiSam system radical SAM enzyme [Vibrio salinus]|uniref:AmmeMemoRadiSam system radical SAM enzyme n=1 Tax=Vibrio salinus TaxID=2899784 RepID=UPI001E324643|nr:AmmeMemoRadiSam system radical SAM enzyme [Vibrio salinus]MCE0495513.1 AmmeMemoRadiSam system radical SAM enzyme [Vibrio salinus]